MYNARRSFREDENGIKYKKTPVAANNTAADRIKLDTWKIWQETCSCESRFYPTYTHASF